MLKVHITRRESSILVEGDKIEVDAILRDYWKPSDEPFFRPHLTDLGIDGNKGDLQGTDRPTSSAEGKAVAGRTIDAIELANRIKSDPRFEAINSKVLSLPANWINKCKMVALIADQPITSGDVKRVLDRLRIKSNLPTLSMALSQNSADFLTEGVNPVRYVFSKSATEAFERWLGFHG